MGLLDGFEKLITEHGSAAILKERIALANDKYATLEQKLAASELRSNNFEADNQRLKIDLEKAKVEIQNLKKLTEQPHGSRLEEVKEKVLCLISQRENTSIQAIIQHLAVSEQLALFHLGDLQTAKLIRNSTRLTVMGLPPPTTYALTQEGRRYLVTHGLLA